MQKSPLFGALTSALVATSAMAADLPTRKPHNRPAPIVQTYVPVQAPAACDLDVGSDHNIQEGVDMINAVRAAGAAEFGPGFVQSGSRTTLDLSKSDDNDGVANQPCRSHLVKATTTTRTPSVAEQLAGPIAQVISAGIEGGAMIQAAKITAKAAGTSIVNNVAANASANAVASVVSKSIGGGHKGGEHKGHEGGNQIAGLAKDAGCACNTEALNALKKGKGTQEVTFDVGGKGLTVPVTSYGHGKLDKTTLGRIAAINNGTAEQAVGNPVAQNVGGLGQNWDQTAVQAINNTPKDGKPHLEVLTQAGSPEKQGLYYVTTNPNDSNVYIQATQFSPTIPGTNTKASWGGMQP